MGVAIGGRALDEGLASHLHSAALAIVRTGLQLAVEAPLKVGVTKLLPLALAAWLILPVSGHGAGQVADVQKQ